MPSGRFLTSPLPFQIVPGSRQQRGRRLRDLLLLLRKNLPHTSASDRHAGREGHLLARQRQDEVLRPAADGRVLPAQQGHPQPPADALRRVQVLRRPDEQRQQRETRITSCKVLGLSQITSWLSSEVRIPMAPSLLKLSSTVDPYCGQLSELCTILIFVHEAFGKKVCLSSETGFHLSVFW